MFRIELKFHRRIWFYHDFLEHGGTASAFYCYWTRTLVRASFSFQSESVKCQLFISIMLNFSRSTHSTKYFSKAHRQSHVLYLTLLAFFDVLIAGAYIPLMSVSQLADYLLSPVLLRAWYRSLYFVSFNVLLGFTKNCLLVIYLSMHLFDLFIHRSIYPHLINYAVID